MIVKCDCKHEGQDALHGKGNRVGNKTTKNQTRCTVCLSQNNIKEIDKVNKK